MKLVSENVIWKSLEFFQEQFKVLNGWSQISIISLKKRRTEKFRSGGRKRYVYLIERMSDYSRILQCRLSSHNPNRPEIWFQVHAFKVSYSSFAILEINILSVPKDVWQPKHKIYIFLYVLFLDKKNQKSRKICQVISKNLKILKVKKFIASSVPPVQLLI